MTRPNERCASLVMCANRLRCCTPRGAASRPCVISAGPHVALPTVPSSNEASLTMGCMSLSLINFLPPSRCGRSSLLTRRMPSLLARMPAAGRVLADAAQPHRGGVHQEGARPQVHCFWMPSSRVLPCSTTRVRHLALCVRVCVCVFSLGPPRTLPWPPTHPPSGTPHVLPLSGPNPKPFTCRSEDPAATQGPDSGVCTHGGGGGKGGGVCVSICGWVSWGSRVALLLVWPSLKKDAGMQWGGGLSLGPGSGAH